MLELLKSTDDKLTGSLFAEENSDASVHITSSNGSRTNILSAELDQL